MARVKQPVSVDGIEFDALIDQSVNYEADVPEYPTEKGFSVSDNVSLKARTISMTLYVSDTPVTWSKRFGSGKGRVESVVKRLEKLYFSKKVITVVTSDSVYSNVVISNMSISKTLEVGYAREIPLTFKEITIVESKTVSIPASYGKSGMTAAPAGTASISCSSSGSGSSSSKSSGKSGSILYNAASSLGLIK